MRGVVNKLKWHRWFAWRPVRIEGRLIWFHFIERRKQWNCRPCYWPDGTVAGSRINEWWEYRDAAETTPNA